MTIKKIKNKNAGFTLLFSVLVISIILNIASILSVFVIRELIISGIGRESQKAFFASDSGAECALFWDLKYPGMEKSAFDKDTTQEINCAGTPHSVGGSPISEFTLGFDNGSCAEVTVDKSFSGTILKSRGYNTCNLDDPNRVERALQISY